MSFQLAARVNQSNDKRFCTSPNWLNATGPTQTDGGDGLNATDYKTILLTKPSEHVSAIQLNRPKTRNAFGLDTASEFSNAFSKLEADSSTRCVVLSGNGPDFTSGVDLKSFMGVYAKLQETEDIAHRAKLLKNTIEKFQAPFKQMYSFSKPIICIPHGLCLGLGIELAACSDIRYCTRDTKMAIREVLIGIAADVGSLQLMPRLVANQSLLNELLFTGRYLEPEEALNLGFVSRICDSKETAMADGLKLAETIAKRSPVAVQGSKKNMRFSHDKPFLVGLDYNAVWNAAMMQGSDVVKAIGAILSKDDEAKFDDF